MSDFSLGYKIIPLVSWTYLSSLLMIALYFKFNRFFSVRNLDLILIVLLAPGLLIVTDGATHWNQVHDRIQAQANLASENENDPETENDGSSLTSAKRPTDSTGNGHAANLALNSETPRIDDQPLATEISDPVTNEEIAAADLAATNPEAVPPELRNIDPEDLREKLAAQRQMRWGYILLFIAAGFVAIRMLIDPMMVRRPMLEPNLSFGGLSFLGGALLLFLIVNVIVSKPTTEDLKASQMAVDLLERRANDKPLTEAMQHGPGYGPIYVLPWMATFAASNQVIESNDPATKKEIRFVMVTKLMAVVCQLAIVGGLFYIGYFHFENARMGIGIAVLYLMLPYTAEMTGRIVHILPAALLVWAVALYRRPWVSGILVGMATGVFYYPLFLLPLWVSFYWRRGRWRFLSGVLATVGVLVFSLIFISVSTTHFVEQLVRMFGIWTPRMENLQGIWGLGWDSIYRLPILVTFTVISLAFILWPAQKNLGTLICCSCALMAIVQFWHGYGGGLLIGWYLPLGLLAFFRPNLEDRVALTVLNRSKRKNRQRKDEKNVLNAA